MNDNAVDWSLLDRLSATIENRAGSDRGDSYVAGLLASGARKCAEKVGEEAVETALAAVAGRREETVAESADLIFHLLVLWQATGIEARDVLAELARREGISGLAEKAQRER